MNELERIAAKCLKPIEHQIYEPDRQKVIKAIVEELEKAKATIVIETEDYTLERLILEKR
jgi:uncharacterized protein YqgQ